MRTEKVNGEAHSDYDYWRSRLSSDPTSGDAMIGQASACLRISPINWEEAVQLLGGALRLNPGNLTAHVLMGDALASKASKTGEIDDWTAAIAAYTRGCAISKYAEHCHCSLAHIYFVLKDRRKAIEHLEMALHINPRNRSASSALAASRLARGDVIGAFKAFTQYR